jgi:hypothetical protein
MKLPVFFNSDKSISPKKAKEKEKEKAEKTGSISDTTKIYKTS